MDTGSPCRAIANEEDVPPRGRVSAASPHRQGTRGNLLVVDV